MSYLGREHPTENLLAQQDFDVPYLWLNSRTFSQDAQKGRSARPQRAKRRGVRFGTLSL